MSMNYSSSMNYYPQNYVTPKKSTGKQAIKGATIGAIALGTANLGWQKFVLSKHSKGFFCKTAEKAGKELMSNKKGFWIKVLDNMLEISYKGKLNWAKAGKAALIGGGIFGGLAALVNIFKNKRFF